MPSVTRTVIAKLETGRREAVSTAELQVLAYALGVPPVLLLFPLGYAETVELLPGHQVGPWAAIEWFYGNISDPSDPASDPPMGSLNPLMLWSNYGFSAVEAESLYAERMKMLPEGKHDDDLDRHLGLAVSTVRNIRAVMRSQGMLPPKLRPELARILRESGTDGDV